MKKNLMVLLTAAAFGGLAGPAHAGDNVIPGADCLPFWGSAEVHSRLNYLQPCTMTVPVIVYLTGKDPQRLAVFATVTEGLTARGNCLAPESDLGRVTIVRHAEGEVGSLSVWGDNFSLTATPADMGAQQCLALRIGPDTAVTSADVAGWDDQHVLIATQ